MRSFKPIINLFNDCPQPQSSRRQDPSSGEDVESQAISSELPLFKSSIAVADLGLFLVSVHRVSCIRYPYDREMAPPEQNTFVFIDEDQRHKYSKSTLSAINAQVAKHAHKQRRGNVKPKPKSKSAPSSPPATGASECEKTSDIVVIQHDQINKTARRTSAPAGATLRRGSSDSQTSLVRHVGSPPKERSRSLPQPKTAKETQRAEENAKQDDQKDETPPGDLADLFQDLCRITKYPAYQAFPFFLNLEERRLAHYCKHTTNSSTPEVLIARRVHRSAQR